MPQPDYDGGVITRVVEEAGYGLGFEAQEDGCYQSWVQARDRGDIAICGSRICGFWLYRVYC